VEDEGNDEKEENYENKYGCCFLFIIVCFQLSVKVEKAKI